MLTVEDFIEKSKGKTKVYKGFQTSVEKDVTNKLTVCIPDMHLLEKGKTDDFYCGKKKNIDRFLNLLGFLLEIKKQEGNALEIIQLGDLYDLWQARGNTNLITEAYPDIIGLIGKIKAIYVLGNHDFDLIKWYRNKTFGRKWTHYSEVGGNKTVMYEHGFQADFFNNQASWSGVIGREITLIVGLMEYINPDIDVILGNAWESVSRIFSVYNSGLTAAKNPDAFSTHEFLKYYISQMEKFNQGNSDDHSGKTDLWLSVVAHTHNARLVQKPGNDRNYYLMDCGCWVNGAHEFGLISGKEIAICQWE
jgi:UDP-2,3-diacylglucosamine pyrophosphatase LpxH